MTDDAGDESPEKIDDLVHLAVVSAIADTLSRAKRLQLISKLEAIADDREREDNVVELRAPARRARINNAMKRAAKTVRRTAQLITESELLQPPRGFQALNRPSPTKDRT